MNQTTPLRVFAYLGLVYAFAACSSESPSTSGSTPCVVDAQCAATESCLGGFCIPVFATGDVAPIEDVAGDIADAEDVEPEGDAPPDSEEDAAPDSEPDVPPVLECEVEDRNACGGCDSLTLAGREFVPGSSCGACGGGVVVCDGPNSIRCSGAAGRNECQGCEFLPGPIGAGCGVCGNGGLACADSPIGVECSGATTNPCGGCAPLDEEPGTSCDEGAGAGVWLCQGAELTTCGVGSDATNVCGGSDELTYRGEPAVVGAPCGPSLIGALICGDSDELQCTVDDSPNSCGGAALLAGEPGETCALAADCGAVSATWRCADEVLAEELGIVPFDGVVCMPGADRPENVCGGCTALDGQPGSACEDGAGIWICSGPDGVFCQDGDPGCDLNLCGGCDELLESLGTACGICETGIVACDGPNAVSCFGELAEDDAINECGGCGPLSFGGRQAAPGDSCGVCGSGSLACAGPDGLTCEDDAGPAALNECGGCGLIEEELGESCGDCDTGIWICAIGGSRAICAGGRGASGLNACGGCDEMGGLGEECGSCGGVWACDETAAICDSDVLENVCGVCGPPLAGAPGDACGECGTGDLACAGDGLSFTCEGDLGAAAYNDCGGCTEFTDELGESCGPCGDGNWVCGDDDDSLVCSDGEPELNECGGCAPLSADPGDPCGVCGSGAWSCGGADTTICFGDAGAGARNLCGGCAELEGAPTSACGACGTGAWQCDGEEAVECIGGSAELNECGGCAALDASLGSTCGTCDTGIVACDGIDATFCEGDEGPGILNGCGGCTELANPPGGGCGECGSGTYGCDGTDATICEGDAGLGATNACGGCGVLDGAPETSCGTCGTGLWRCSGDLASVTCDGDAGAGALNACGGCAALAGELGAACGACDSGVFACDGTEALLCEGEEPLNACGGCGSLSGSPDAPCGTCDTGRLTCNDELDGLDCLGDEGAGALNDCGGCEEMPGDEGDVCGDCSTHVLACDGTGFECTTDAACPPCEDGIQNGDESDIDCGGDCDGCPIGGSCDGPTDCTSGLCAGGLCTALPGCDDGVENGSETGLDCGGPDCEGCPNGGGCVANSDCGSGYCDVGLCADEPTCDDGIQNAAETDVDCGGGECGPCVVAESCIEDVDCGVAWTCEAFVCTPLTLSNPWIAFVAPGPLALDVVFLIRADGTGLTQLGTTDIVQFDPVWSPDGQYLAYRTFGAPAPIRIVELATGTVTSLSPGLSSYSGPSWSPVGDALIVEGTEVGNSDLWIVPVDGSAPYQAGVTPFSDAAPDWQFRHEVFIVQDESGIFEVFSRDLRTLTDTRRTSGSAILGGPDASWTDDRVAFVRRTSSVTSQAIVWNTVTGTFQAVGTGESVGPSFYPDASQMVVIDRSPTGLDIFIADPATGALVRQVTDTSTTEGSLAVSPLESADIDVWLVP